MSKAQIAAWLDKCRYVISQTCETLTIFFRKFMRPVMWVVVPIWAWLAPKYVALYKKMAYKDGEHIPSRGAGALSVLVSGTILGLYLNIWYVLPGVFTFTYDAVAYNVFSYKTEKLYFSRPQWIEDVSGDGDQVLTVFSCQKKDCDLDSSKEYRFRDSVYLNVARWVTRFEPYDPADVAGVMMAELNYCEVTAYGKRFKPLDWYPYIYDVTCTAVPQGEALGAGNKAENSPTP